MPLRDYDLKVTYDEDFWQNLYGVRLGYVRAVVSPRARQTARGIVRRLPIPATARIAVVGAGFGAVSESLQMLLPDATVVSTETSTWIQSTKGETETDDLRAMISAAGIDPDGAQGQRILAAVDDGGSRARTEILNQDSMSKGSRKAVERAAGGLINLVLTDDLVAGLTDAEVVTLTQALEQYGGAVYHMTIPRVPAWEEAGRQDVTNYNRKTMQEWKALGDANGLSALWVDLNSFEIW